MASALEHPGDLGLALDPTERRPILVSWRAEGADIMTTADTEQPSRELSRVEGVAGLLESKSLTGSVACDISSLRDHTH